MTMANAMPPKRANGCGTVCAIYFLDFPDLYAEISMTKSSCGSGLQARVNSDFGFEKF
jgi:hypothetical protein